jgi:hypothetical protein
MFEQLTVLVSILDYLQLISRNSEAFKATVCGLEQFENASDIYGIIIIQYKCICTIV